MPVVGVYRRHQWTLVIALRHTPEGVLYVAEPWQRLSEPTPEQVGRAVCDVLNSRPEKSMDTPDYALVNLVPTAFGLVSWDDVMDNCIYVQVRRLRDRLVCIPTRNIEIEDDRRGFEDQLADAVETSLSAGADEIGSVVEQALARSR